jgi:uncharacterized protein (TIRG00374 family)
VTAPTDQASAPAPRRPGLLTTLLGVAISVALLAWILRGVSAADLLREARSARLLPLLLTVALATLAFPLRLVRWRLLLRDDAGKPLPVTPLWHAVAIGFMANNVLPFRAGELVRCYAAARLTGTRFAAALSSVAVERVFDGLTVVALLGAALLFAHLPDVVTMGGVPVSVAHAATGAALACTAALALALAVVLFPTAAEAMVRRVVPSPRLAGRLVELIEGIRHGLAVLRSPRTVAGVVFWSLVLWIENASAFYVAFWAFDLPVDFWGALLLQGLLVFGIAVPSTPGYVGVFEAVITAVLLLYGVPTERAAAYALVYHITTFIPITLLGLWSLARTPIALREARQASAS